MHYLFISFTLLIIASDISAKCSESFNTANYKQALIICEKELNKQNNNDTGELLLKLITISHELDLADKNQYYLNQLKNSSSFSQDPKYQFAWNRWNGRNNFYIGELNISEGFFLEALSLAVVSDKKKWIAKSNNDLGVLANRRKQFKKAFMYYNKSLEINKTMDNALLIGNGYTNIGLVYQLLEDYQNAINYYKLALNSYKKHQKINNHDAKISKLILHANESLLKVNLLIDNSDEAGYYAQQIISSSTQQIKIREKIPSIVNFVRLYINKEQYQLAQYFLEKASTLSMQSNNYFASEIKYLFAKLYQKQNLYEQAISNAIEGLNSIDKNDHINLAKFYLLLSQLNEETNVNESLAFLKKHLVNREKLLAQKYNSDIKAVQHKIEKKQIEYELNLERLNRVSKELEIKFLNNKFLIVIILLIFLITGVFTFYLTKKRERKYLLAKIKHHKQQLIMMDENSAHDFSIERDDKNISKKQFCQYLVEAMNNAVNIWEKHTATNRTELADQSGIWTISNDDGTLRTRSLDKYLSTKKIPQNPRWRNVVRTCHFILSDQKLSKIDRDKLENDLSNISTLFQKLSLTSS